MQVERSVLQPADARSVVDGQTTAEWRAQTEKDSCDIRLTIGAMGVTVVSGWSKEVAVYWFAGADAGQIGAGGCIWLVLDREPSERKDEEKRGEEWVKLHGLTGTGVSWKKKRS